MKYQILHHTASGVCLCDTPTQHCGGWVFTYTEQQAKERVAELNSIGVEAWYEPIEGKCWANNENWIG